MTTTLVTGGNGFIGQYVVQALLNRGRSVLVLDRRTELALDRASPAADQIFGDIRDATHVTEAMAHADSWIHLAGVLGTQETIEDPRPAAETNVLGGLNVLEAAARYKLPGVNIAVGNYWMNNPYSITKNSVERFADMYREYRGVAVTNVRVMNAYGPRQSIAAPYGPSKVRKIIPAFVCRALTSTPIEIYGDGQQIMDMIYVADAAEILIRALECTEQGGPVIAPGGETIDAGTGRCTTVKQIAQTVVDAIHGPHAIPGAHVKHLPMRPGEPKHSAVYAIPTMLNLIGYDHNRMVTLEEGVSRTVEYYRTKWLPEWEKERS